MDDEEEEEACLPEYSCMSVLVLYGIALGTLATIVYFVFGG